MGLAWHIDMCWCAKGRAICRLESPCFLIAFKMIAVLDVLLEVLNIGLNFRELLLHFEQSIVHRVCFDEPRSFKVKGPVF